MVARENRGREGEGPEMKKEREEWGNSKEREAGEMSGGKLRNHSFQEKRGGSRLCKVREAGADGCPPPPSLLPKEACILFSRICLSFAAVVLICYFCLFAFLFFCFVFNEKRRSKFC